MSDSAERITEEAVRHSSARLVPKGSVLLTSRASIGHVAIAGNELTTNQGFASFVCREAIFNWYLAYWLWAQAGAFVERATGTTFKEISKSKLRPWPIPLAPLPEQRRIVAKLEKLLTQLDAGVAALKRAQANLKRHKASVLQAACEGRLVPQDPADEPASALLERILAERRAKWKADLIARGKDPGKAKYVEPPAPNTTELPQLPRGWCWARVDEVAEVRLGRQRSPSRAVGPNMRPYLRAANVTWRGLDLSDVKEMDFSPAEQATYDLKYGDVLLSEASGSIAEAGKPAIWRDEIPACCFQNTLIRVRSEGPDFNFLYIVFLRDALEQRFRSIAKGVGIHHLGAQNLSAWMIAVPPIAEQERIVRETDRQLSIIDAVAGELRSGVRRANTLREAILGRAFAGCLVPQDPADEPASTLIENIAASRKKKTSSGDEENTRALTGTGVPS